MDINTDSRTSINPPPYSNNNLNTNDNNRENYTPTNNNGNYNNNLDDNDARYNNNYSNNNASSNNNYGNNNNGYNNDYNNDYGNNNNDYSNNYDSSNSNSDINMGEILGSNSFDTPFNSSNDTYGMTLENTIPGSNLPNSQNNDFSGSLKISVVSNLGFSPIQNAQVRIYPSDDPTQIIYQGATDISGQTEIISLPAPSPMLSEEPEKETPPYSTYNIFVSAEGYEDVEIEFSEIMPNELSLQLVTMNSLSEQTDETPNRDLIVIPPHTLFGDYPSKIPEDEIKPLPSDSEIVLSRVVIPEYVIVHDGAPNDNSAKNYWVKYKDYIKNVASSEIYSTWPESTIYANILVIQSFTLNRVYTEYYRSRGYNFTITSNTAYDQKWIYGRNTYSNINYLVDSVFANYLSRPGVKQPIFTSYCDGQSTSCRGLSQWGSKYLGSNGYSAIQILRNYYGNDIYINTAQGISGVPSSFPGYNLTIGSTGEKVRQLQNQLNRIARNYPAIPTVTADGIYGSRTASAVRKYQSIFNLPQTGVTDYATWYSISNVYVAVTRISEPGT